MGKYRIRVEQDEHAMSPDEWGDDGIFLVGFHKNHFWVPRKGFEQDCFEEGSHVLEGFKEAYHILPLIAYIHSGVSLSLSRNSYPFNDRYSGQVGFVLVSRSEWPEEDKARAAAESLVSEWNQYLSGDVWCFLIEEVETCDLGHEHTTIVESCGGFYGEEVAREEAEGQLEAIIDQSNAKHDTEQEAPF